MNTFFEKLAGTNVKTAPLAETVDLTQLKTPRKRGTTTRPEPVAGTTPAEKAHHLRIENEDQEEPEKSKPEGDEEGELTVDIYDQGDSIIIQSTVAGVKPEDLDISITNDSVTIRGKREKIDEVSENNYYYKELFWGTFARSVILPEEIEEDAAEASLKHGLLMIKLPKKRRGVVQKLKVKVT